MPEITTYIAKNWLDLSNFQNRNRIYSLVRYLQAARERLEDEDLVE